MIAPTYDTLDLTVGGVFCGTNLTVSAGRRTGLALSGLLSGWDAGPSEESVFLKDMRIMHSLMMATREARLAKIEKRKEDLRSWLNAKCGSWSMGEIGGLVLGQGFCGWEFPPLPAFVFKDDEPSVWRCELETLKDWVDQLFNQHHLSRRRVIEKLWNSDREEQLQVFWVGLGASGRVAAERKDETKWTVTLDEAPHSRPIIWCPKLFPRNPFVTSQHDYSDPTDPPLVQTDTFASWDLLNRLARGAIHSTNLPDCLVGLILQFWLGLL